MRSVKNHSQDSGVIC